MHSPPLLPPLPAGSRWRSSYIIVELELQINVHFILRHVATHFLYLSIFYGLSMLTFREVEEEKEDVEASENLFS